MSQDPTQFDPKETTEAKLCAFVDGDLDAAGRAEIEKYLETNPQHRKLLEELKQTRDLMRALPRASAPPDIGETLHGQLERSLLLNDLDAEPAPDTMRISSGAQFRAIAAVLVLALGLGALVYYMLPSSKERVAVVAPPPLAAEHDHEATAPTTTIVPEMEDHTPAVAVTGGPASAPAAPAAPGGTSLADASKEIGNRRALSKTLAGKGEDVFARNQSKAGEVRSQNMVAGAKGGSPSKVGAGDPFRNRVQQTIANFDATQAPSLNNYQCVVVSTTDPAAAKERVNTYLVTNNIKWEPVEEPMPAPIQLAQTQSAFASRMNNTTMRLKQAGNQGLQQNIASNGEPTTTGAGLLVQSGAYANSSGQVAGSGGGFAGAMAARSPASAAAAPTTQLLAFKAKAPAASQPVEGSVSIAQAYKQSQEAQPPADQIAQQQQSQQPMAQPAVTEPEQQLQQQGLEGQFEEAEHYIVARNMTRAQTAELKDLLAKDGAVAVETFDATPDLAQLRDDAGAIANRPQQLAAQVPATQPAEQQLDRSVTDTNGAVAIKKQIETTFPTTDENKLVATTQPTTQRLELAQVRALKPATEPSGNEVLSIRNPATQPTHDVVIVVRTDLQSQQRAGGADRLAPPPSSAPQLAEPVPTTAPAAPVQQQIAPTAAPAPAPTTAPVSP